MVQETGMAYKLKLTEQELLNNSILSCDWNARIPYRHEIFGKPNTIKTPFGV